MQKKLTTKKEHLVKILIEESAKTGLSFRELIEELMYAHNDFLLDPHSFFKVPSKSGTLPAIEHSLIIETLTKHRGNQRRTALELGIPKSTLNDKLKKIKLCL